MRPNVVWFLAVSGVLLTGCEDFWDSPRTTGTAGQGDCLSASEVEASAAAMTITNLKLNSVILGGSFTTTTYEDLGYSACYDETANIMTWVFEANGEPAGDLQTSVDTAGAQDMQGSSSWFRITIYDVDGGGTSQTYSNSDFTIGSWQVDSVDPLDMTIAGAQSNTGGNILEVTLSASANF